MHHDGSIVRGQRDNARAIAEFEQRCGVLATSSETFHGEPDGHRFRPGQEARLAGLEQYPEFNGEIVTITAIRVDAMGSRAYYFRTGNPGLAAQLNWIYEHRLEHMGGESI